MTGIPFDFTPTKDYRNNPWAPSLDRIDSSIGYTWWNTKVVVWMYNAAKGEAHDAHLQRLARAIICPETNHPEVTTND